MLTIHRGMDCNEEKFVAVVDDIVEALDEHGVGQREKGERLMISWPLKPEIVRVWHPPCPYTWRTRS